MERYRTTYQFKSENFEKKISISWPTGVLITLDREACFTITGDNILQIYNSFNDFEKNQLISIGICQRIGRHYWNHFIWNIENNKFTYNSDNSLLQVWAVNKKPLKRHHKQISEINLKRPEH